MRCKRRRVSSFRCRPTSWRCRAWCKCWRRSAQIAYDIALKESTEVGKSIFDVSSGKRTASLYRALAQEVGAAAGDLALPVVARRSGLVANLLRSFGRLGGVEAGTDLEERP